MDDLLALMEKDVVSSSETKKIVTTTTTTTTTTLTNDDNEGKMTGMRKNSHIQSNTMDGYTGLRIVNRRLSRLEMTDQLSRYEFYTCVKLCSMSQKGLESMITSTGGNSKGGGKMRNVATMGLIFTKTGTKLSKQTKSAFSILTMGGTFETGPTITIFLFGSAYSKYTSMIQPGMIVSIQAPNLLPPNNNNNSSNNTILSLSVNEEEQVSIVGTSQDYGICSGHNKNYNNNNSATRCRQYVDLRYGRYCRKHQHQVNNNNVLKTKSNQQSGTFVQRMKQMNATPTYTATSTKTTTKSHNKLSAVLFPNQYNKQGNNYNIQRTNANRHKLSSGMSLYDALATSSVRNDNKSFPLEPSKNDFLTMQNQSMDPSRLLQHAPLHMSKSTTITKNKHFSNPYRKNNTDTSHDDPKRRTNRQNYISPSNINNTITTTQPISLNSIIHSSKQNPNNRQSKEKPKRKLARFEDFDGAVQRPKPNRLFRKVASPVISAPFHNNNNNMNQIKKKKDSILDQQKKLANSILDINNNNNRNSSSLLTLKVATTNAKAYSLGEANNKPQQQQQKKRRTKNNNTSLSLLSLELKKKEQLSALKECGLLFGNSVALTQEEKNRIVSTESQFATEAQAEQYVKNRKAIIELERQEDYKTKTKKNNDNDSRIVTEWKCQTCQKVFRIRPKLCIAYNHKIVVQRNIQKKLTVVESRLKKGNNSMVLGAGLEWSGFKHKSIS